MTQACSRALVVVNPSSGGGRTRRWAPAIGQWLQAKAPFASLCLCDQPDEARRAIGQLPEGSRVVLVGGDGTLFHALPALLERKHSLGVVALGSGNDLARAVGVHLLPWQEALSWALTQEVRAIDVGLCSTEHGRWPFLSSLAGGFDAGVGGRAQQGPAWLRGTPRYLWATVRQLLALRTYPITASLDSVHWHRGPCLFVSVLNTPTYGAGMPAVPHADLHDGQLDVVVAGDLNRRRTVALLPRLLVGRHLTHPQVHTRPMRRLEVHSTLPVALAADGEVLPDATQWRIEVLASALPVVMGPLKAVTIGGS